MWKIVQIFDGEYGCEELAPGAKPKVSVTIENESGEQKYESVEDAWLIDHHLDVGSTWPEKTISEVTKASEKTIMGDTVKNMQKVRTKAVLFDLDGTLIDTEKYYRIFWPKALEYYGYQMSDEQFLSMRSLGRPFALAQLQAWYGEDFDYEAAKKKRSEMMNAYMQVHGIQVKPGAVQLLEYLKEQHIPAAVATATDPERTKKYLGELGLLSYFCEIISATMVKEGKPSPDVYLYACSRLGQAPESCMAVEDSPNGVLSAWRAGCQVVMVPDLTQPDEELKEKLYARVDTLAEIIPLIK